MSYGNSPFYCSQIHTRSIVYCRYVLSILTSLSPRLNLTLHEHVNLRDFAITTAHTENCFFNISPGRWASLFVTPFCLSYCSNLMLWAFWIDMVICSYGVLYIDMQNKVMFFRSTFQSCFFPMTHLLLIYRGTLFH